ncbi:MAG TPA: PKD domain-containing protein [Anaerolineales bacterium]|nr:PKD domain-containing protein [Anaerolineales bacterium]
MKTKMSLRNLLKILPFAALTLLLALGGLSQARAAIVPGTVTAWGGYLPEEIAVPSDLTDVVSISADASYTLALKSDGTVVAWGVNNHGQTNVPAGLADVVAISAGGLHSLALKSDGTVVGWGDNHNGEVSIPPGLTSVIAINAGNYHSLALKSDGTVIAWGLNTDGQATVPADLADVIAIAAGGMHSLALKSDHTVVAWGNNSFSQLNIPSGLSDVVAISAGFTHNIALKSNGTVVAWGYNGHGETDIPAGLAGVIAIEAGAYHNLALQADGTVVAWGSNRYGQTTIPLDLVGVAALAAGLNHSAALVPTVIAENTAPTANPGGPYLGAVNTSISFDGSLSTDPDGDALTYVWDMGDGTLGASAALTHAYTVAGIYPVCLTVNDGIADSAPACTLAVVYDPANGFVTGGGWLISPEGAYKPDTSLSGKASFGFMAKYQKGSNTPTGTTSFKFEIAGLSFTSQSYEWLVVNQGGTNAQFKGSGTINGMPDPLGNAYKFMLWASDSSPDTFRIRIWWEDAAGEYDVYDNVVQQAIGGGNIVVHTGK